MTAKNRITVNLDDDEYEALQRIAAGSDRSLSWLGRKAICDFIERRDRAETPLLAELNDSSENTRRSTP